MTKFFSVGSGILFLLSFTIAAFASDPCLKVFRSSTAAEIEQEKVHAALASDLYSGKIIGIRSFKQNDNKHALYIVTIESKGGGTIEAFFKPRVYGDEDGWARAPMEYIAYPLNRALEMDYVPPTAYRRGLHLTVNGNTYSEGAFILKADDFKALATLPGERFTAASERVESDHRVLAVLLQNQDGHYHNLGEAKHWITGDRRPVFIDWGASLRRGANLTMTHYPAYGNSRPVTRFSMATLHALQCLSMRDLQPWISAHFISEKEAKGILSRRDGIVSYFEELLRTNGDAAVISE